MNISIIFKDGEALIYFWGKTMLTGISANNATLMSANFNARNYLPILMTPANLTQPHILADDPQYSDNEISFDERILLIQQEMEFRNNNIGFVLGGCLRQIYDNVSYYIGSFFTKKEDKLDNKNEKNQIDQDKIKTLSELETSVSDQEEQRCINAETSFTSSLKKLFLEQNELITAIIREDIYCIRKYKKHHNINQPDSRGYYPIQAAIDTDNPLVIKEVIHIGAHTNIIGETKNTLLRYALEKQKLKAIMCLINIGADLYEINNQPPPILLKFIKLVGATAESFLKNLPTPIFVELIKLGDSTITERVLNDIVLHKPIIKDVTALEILTDMKMEEDDTELNLLRSFTDTLIAKMKQEGVKKEDLRDEGALVLAIAIFNNNKGLIDYYLSLDIDINKRVNAHAEIEATPLQVASSSNNAEVLQYLDKKRGTPSTEIKSCQSKNPWTEKFEQVIQKLCDPSNDVQYTLSTNEYGNSFYNPIINDVEYEMEPIIKQMDWLEVYLPDLAESNDGINGYVGKSYLTGINAFLKGELYYHNLYNLCNDDITNLWRLTGGIAHGISQTDPEPKYTRVCRGQSDMDTLVRSHEISFISTSTDFSHCLSFNPSSPIYIFDTIQHGVHSHNYQDEIVLAPMKMSDYHIDEFKVHGTTYRYLTLKESQPTEQNDSSPEKNIALFESLLFQVVNGKYNVTTQKNINDYGQIFYDILLDEQIYNMDEIVSNMDWSLLRLSQAFEDAFQKSPYHYWDEQSYMSSWTFREDAPLLDHPVKLYDINKAVGLLHRPNLPKQCGDRPCQYNELYQNLSDTEMGLIFQYTSTSNKALNAFLKGNFYDHFQTNLNAHKNRWTLIDASQIERGTLKNESETTFDVKDPINWWLYAARITNALNKIPSEPASRVCRGQTYHDRHARIYHSAPLSFSPDFGVCKKYLDRDGEMVVVDALENGKDITGLSFHPTQRELLTAPAILHNYKRVPSVVNNNYLKAKLKPSRNHSMR